MRDGDEARFWLYPTASVADDCGSNAPRAGAEALGDVVGNGQDEVRYSSNDRIHPL
jgi:hypothetical protein